MSKPSVDIKINEKSYKQIIKKSKDDEEMVEWWKNQPKDLQPEEKGSGLHIFQDPKISPHLDLYDDKGKTISKAEAEKKDGLGGVFGTIKNGKKHIGAIPKGVILILDKNNSVVTWITKEFYEKNKDKYKLINSRGYNQS